MVIQNTENDVKTNSGPFPFPRGWLLVLALLLLAGALGYTLRLLQLPGAASADVGFARDMTEHHRQAVEMSKLVYDRSDDELVRLLAYDIMMTQQAQIGMMSGWLDSWGQPQHKTGPRMEWMGMSVSGLMPGMATREELNRLAAAEGVEADLLFMQLMINHHLSGVAMAQAAVDQARTPLVRDLAQSMVDGQQFEIEYMQQLLLDRGFEPAPAMEMDMEMEMSHD